MKRVTPVIASLGVAGLLALSGCGERNETPRPAPPEEDINRSPGTTPSTPAPQTTPAPQPTPDTGTNNSSGM